jgi:hypothetical protein
MNDTTRFITSEKSAGGRAAGAAHVLRGQGRLGVSARRLLLTDVSHVNPHEVAQVVAVTQPIAERVRLHVTGKIFVTDSSKPQEALANEALDRAPIAVVLAVQRVSVTSIEEPRSSACVLQRLG